MSAPRRMAIMRALVRPELWLGCDRSALILLATLTFVFVGPAGIAAGRYWTVVLGGVFFTIGMRLLRELGKREPFAREVYMRAARYPGRMKARARWDVPAPRRLS